METVKTQRASSVLQLRWEQAEGFIAKWSLKSKMISSSVTNFAGFVTQIEFCLSGDSWRLFNL